MIGHHACLALGHRLKQIAFRDKGHALLPWPVTGLEMRVKIIAFGEKGHGRFLEFSSHDIRFG